MAWISINQWKKRNKIGVKRTPTVKAGPTVKTEPKVAVKAVKAAPKDNSKRQEPEPPFKLLGFDTFSSEWYSLGSFHTEGRAMAAAQAKLRVLEHSQPSRSSGGQSGIQDRIFIERPDGTRVRVLPEV